VVVDEETLKEFENDTLISLVLQLKKKHKMLSTYHLAIRDKNIKGIIRPTLNQCATVTGRLSCTKPNLQNIPRDSKENRVKEVFVSRYPTGSMLELDFSQLEIVALAYLSGDETLKDDILTGRDMHTIRAQELFEKEYITKEERTIAKTLSFQLQYGAGATKMAKMWKLPKKLCQRFIDLYYKRYPRVKEWQEEMISTVKMMPSVDDNPVIANGQPRRIVRVQSVTGRLYTFMQHPSPDFIRNKDGSEWSFKPTEIKNYFVQGFATGDIVPLIAGFMYVQAIKNYMGIKFVNTVHDSILADIPDTGCIPWIQEFMKQAEDLVRKYLAEDFDMPLRYSLGVGKNWANVEEL